ncbi:6766_t:CDS:2 [Cetraspora pellucida]|uniref:6766_t:CDS:1 n=1 Tax=Cetraspora pellucida TaxID=1433469 RepID=A0A9N8VIR6_9GLOM|nr:6766_t:CDS:2 [Cetraspora pellucida]
MEDVSNNIITFDGVKALIDSLNKNTILMVLILSGNPLALGGENTFMDGFSTFPICSGLCCNKLCLKEEREKAGNKVIIENFSHIYFPHYNNYVYFPHHYIYYY